VQGFARNKKYFGEIVKKVKNVQGSKIFKVLALISIASVLSSNAFVANAATKTITCYKGTVVKKVSAANPKCPTGYSTKKPVAVKTTTPAKSGASATSYQISATYTGKVSLLWSESDVQISSVSAKGTGNNLGLDTLTGNGSAAPSSSCDNPSLVGTLGGGGNTIKITVDSTSKACADSDAAPATVTLSGNAVITGGTGKFAGATGTLKVTGSFKIKSTVAGSSESPALEMTFTGNVNTK
jgi:hypothetical protein